MDANITNLAALPSPLILYGPNSYDAPVTTPSLTANMVCRVIFAIVANLVCLVPLRLLYRNGELAVTVFILNLEVMNLQTIANTLIWRNNDVQSWWHGQYLCDGLPYLHNFNYGLYGTCLLAIMRNLALQVGLCRVTPLTVRERRRKNLIQAVIIFPIPVLQVAMTWPLAAQRFMVGTFIGCSWSPYPSWPILLFYVIPPVVLAVLTAIYAVLTFIRYRQATRSTQAALSSNQLAQARAQRTRRRLYLMSLSILVPYLPVVAAFAAMDVLAYPVLLPFDIYAIHNPPFPNSWNSILLLSSRDLDFAPLNQPWIPILTAVPIFLFFGMTKEALNDYRRVLVFFRLGKVFPALNEEYDPDRAAYGGSSLGSSAAKSLSINTLRGLGSHTSSKHPDVSCASKPRTSSEDVPPSQSLELLPSMRFGNELEANLLRDGRHRHPSTVQRPPPTAKPLPVPSFTASTELPYRNPFLFRTTLNFPFSSFRLPHFVHFATPATPPSKPSLPLHVLPSPPKEATVVTLEKFCDGKGDAKRVETKVWSQEQHSAAGDVEEEGEKDSVVVIQTLFTRESHNEGVRKG